MCIRDRYSIFNLSEENRNYKKIEGTTNIQNHFRRYNPTKVNEKTFIEPFSRVVIGDIGYLLNVTNIQDYSYDQINDREFVKKVEASTEKDSKEKDSKDKDSKDKDSKDKDSKDKNSKQKEIPEETKTKYKQFNQKLWSTIESVFQNDNIITKKPELIFFMKYVFSLFSEAWIEVSRIPSEPSSQQHRLNVLNQTIRLLRIYVENVSKVSATIRGKFLQQVSQLATTVGYLIYQCCAGYKATSKKLFDEIICIFSTMKKILQLENGENILNVPLSLVREGIDQFQEKVFETNHPYERGKVQTFDTCNFPGAIALVVEFDKRCQSDASQDFLVLISWYENHQSHSGYYSSLRDSMSNCYRISGKPMLRRPLLLLGNILQVEFTSSGQARDCLLYTSPSPRDRQKSRMPSSA
eukprot:TRINITY_DN1021_c0_g1_i11.p1 TRINITY_DN1021_c0_g1~~TRINITY_DN1021_c0_g1_i11.p1  ORF type:complete len:410 (+),score=84.11 TRINITY_DN1021_c0_g1_i11:65-1294(+)